MNPVTTVRRSEGGRIGPAASACADRALLDEGALDRTIALERKRAERGKKLFVLMLVDVSATIAAGKSSHALDKIVNSLHCAIRETDWIGWHKTDSVLGVVFTDINSAAAKAAILLRVRGLLYRDLPFDDFGQISISSHVFPETWDHDVPQRPSSPVLYPDVSKRERSTKLFSICKRTIDMVGSGFGLVLGFPIFLLIAILVKLSSQGPVLFRQTRVGQYGKPFVFLKFRSMYTGNDASVHKNYVNALIRGRAECKPDGKGEDVYKLTRDGRVTRIGAFLRKTSLDELPQLYNVFKGEMSLVGPRPAIPYEVDAYEAWHRRRVLEAKPGMTGLWQVKGRSRVTFDEMVRLDVQYANARSLWLDLKILLATPRAVLFGAGAW